MKREKPQRKEKREIKDKMMIHKGCGGEIVEHPTMKYEYVHSNGKKEYPPLLYCKKCLIEILGDSEIIIPDYDSLLLEEKVSTKQNGKIK